MMFKFNPISISCKSIRQRPPSLTEIRNYQNNDFKELRSDWEKRIEDVIIEMSHYCPHGKYVLMDISKVTEEFNALMDSIEPK